MQLLIVLLLAVAASATNYGYSYAPSYSAYGGYGDAYGYSNLGGYGSSLYGAPYTYGDSYAYAPSYYGGSSYGSGVAYVADKPAVSYVSKPATYIAPAIQKYVAPTVSYVSQPAVQYVAAPQVEKYVAPVTYVSKPAVSYVSKPAVQYVAAAPRVQKYVAPAPVTYVSKPAVQYVAPAPRVEKIYTVPTYQKPAAPVQPSRISFILGNSGASTTSNRNPPVQSYTSKKIQVPKQTEYVPKQEEYVPKPETTFTQAKPSKVSAPAPVKPAQVQIPIVSQQPQTKTSYRNVAPGEESYSTFDVQPGSKLAIGDQTYVVVPVGDYDGNKESVYTHSLVGNDKSSISEGSFFPFPSDTYTQDKPTSFKYPLVSPVAYTSSENAGPDVSYIYNLEQPAGISAGSYGSGNTQGRPSLFYGSDYTEEKAPAYGPEYSEDDASATLYSSDNKQPISDQGSSSYAGDQASAGNYGSDDKGDSAVSYGSDYSGSIGSLDSYGSAQSGIKTNQGSYGSS